MKTIYPIDQIIQANLDLPTTQRILKNEYRIYNFNYHTITSPKFVSIHDNWAYSKKDKFYRILGGKVYFKKVKDLFNTKNKEINNERII